MQISIYIRYQKKKTIQINIIKYVSSEELFLTSHLSFSFDISGLFLYILYMYYIM